MGTALYFPSLGKRLRDSLGFIMYASVRRGLLVAQTASSKAPSWSRPPAPARCSDSGSLPEGDRGSNHRPHTEWGGICATPKRHSSRERLVFTN